jgi:SAM-dependent methyltransferase
MNPEDPNPSYGVVDHYLDEKGREYFAWQGQDGIRQANFNRSLWQPHISPEDDVLDFGCGGGFLLKVLDAGRKTGVEVNPHAREMARQLGIEVHATVEEIEGTFDRIISSHALEHVPHPRQAVMELREKLRSDGRMLLLVPLDDWRSRSNRRYRQGNVDMHLHTWTPQLLGNLLTTCGMHVEEVRVITHAWPPMKELLWKVSPAMFNAASRVWSVLNRQRQLMAVARLP